MYTYFRFVILFFTFEFINIFLSLGEVNRENTNIPEKSIILFAITIEIYIANIYTLSIYLGFSLES